MQIPPAGLIEAAADQIDHLPIEQRSKQGRELIVATGHDSLDFIAGYELGLETSRVMIAQNTAVVLAKLDPDQIL